MTTRTATHVDPDVVPLLSAPDEDRIRHVQADRFVLHTDAAAALDTLRDFRDRPVAIRPPCMALVGDAGSGKSTLLSRFLEETESGDGLNERRAVMFTLSALPRLDVTQVALLRALDVPVPPVGYRRTGMADHVIVEALKSLKTRVVGIDDVQHIDHLTRRERPMLWDWMKWLSTTCRLSVVTAGIPGSEALVLHERQLNTRFWIARLRRWQSGPAFAQFLKALERSLPLKRPSGLHRPDLQAAILSESQQMTSTVGITRSVTQVIEHAAIAAIRSGDERIVEATLTAWREPALNAA